MIFQTVPLLKIFQSSLCVNCGYVKSSCRELRVSRHIRPTDSLHERSGMPSASTVRQVSISYDGMGRRLDLAQQLLINEWTDELQREGSHLAVDEVGFAVQPVSTGRRALFHTIMQWFIKFASHALCFRELVSREKDSFIYIYRCGPACLKIRSSVLFIIHYHWIFHGSNNFEASRLKSRK